MHHRIAGRGDAERFVQSSCAEALEESRVVPNRKEDAGIGSKTLVWLIWRRQPDGD
jgi:hypothetical protein